MLLHVLVVVSYIPWIHRTTASGFVVAVMIPTTTRYIEDYTSHKVLKQPLHSQTQTQEKVYPRANDILTSGIPETEMVSGHLYHDITQYKNIAY